MESKRATILMAILLVLILAYVSRPLWWPSATATGQQAPEPPLSGANSISGLRVHQDQSGHWIADFDYFYTGAPQRAWIVVFVLGNGVVAAGTNGEFVMPPAASAGSIQRGQHHLSLELQRPLAVQSSVTTTQVLAEIRTNTFVSGQPLAPGQTAAAFQKTVASQQVEQAIDWPDMDTWLYERQFATKSTEQILKESIAQIDSGDGASLAAAKRTLELMVSRDPNFVPAYIELARIAMKTNWGPEGLHQAEALLKSALQIEAESVNAKILLGYVYAHQARYKAAEALFADAAKTPTNNLWLWSNWGEVLVMQNKIDRGIEKYREGLARPRTNDTYDRARLDAYFRLIALLENRKDFDGAEVLHRQRASEFSQGNCFNADYALFLLQRRGDSDQATVVARKAVDGHCRHPKARNALGLAYYSAWAHAPAEKKPELLNQARVFLPIGPRAVHLMASSDRTAGALKALVDSGEPIDQSDNNKIDALGYAIDERDYAAASRLMRLGARPDKLIGHEQVPVALLPVISGDLEGIRLMRKFGVNYSELQYQGSSVLDQVKRSGNRELIRAIDPKADRL